MSSLFRSKSQDEDESPQHLDKTTAAAASIAKARHHPHFREIMIENDKRHMYMDSYHPKDTQKDISFEDTLFSDNPVRATTILAKDKLSHLTSTISPNNIQSDEFLNPIDGTIHPRKEGFINNVLLGRRFQQYEKAYNSYNQRIFAQQQPFLTANPVLFNNPPSTSNVIHEFTENAQDLKDRAVRWAQTQENKAVQWVKDDYRPTINELKDKIQSTIAHPEDLRRDVASRINTAIDSVNAYTPIDDLPHIQQDDVNLTNVMKVAAVPLAIGTAAMIAKSSSSPTFDLNDLKDMDMDDIQKYITKQMKDHNISLKSAKKAVNKAMDTVEEKFHIDLNDLKDMDMDDIQKYITKQMKDHNISLKSAKKAVNKAMDTVEEKFHIDLNDLKDMDMDDIQKYITKQMKDHNISLKSAKKTVDNVLDNENNHKNELQEQLLSLKSSLLGSTENDKNREFINDSIKALLTTVLGVNIAKIAGGDEIIRNISQKLLNTTDNGNDDDDNNTNNNNNNNNESSSLLPSTKTMLIATTLLSLGAVAKYCHDHHIDMKKVSKEMFDEIITQSTHYINDNVSDDNVLGQRFKQIVNDTTVPKSGGIGDALGNLKEGTKFALNKWNVSREYQHTIDEFDKTYQLLKKQASQNILSPEAQQSFKKLSKNYNQWKLDVNHLVGVENPAMDKDGDILFPNKDELKHCIEDFTTMFQKTLTDTKNNDNTSPTGAIATTIASAISIEDLKALGANIALDLINPTTNGKNGTTATDKVQKHIVDYIKQVSNDIHNDILTKNTAMNPLLQKKTELFHNLIEDSKILYADVQNLASAVVRSTPEMYDNTKKLLQNNQNQQRQVNIRQQVLASISAYNLTSTSAIYTDTDESNYSNFSSNNDTDHDNDDNASYHFHRNLFDDNHCYSQTDSDLGENSSSHDRSNDSDYDNLEDYML